MAECAWRRLAVLVLVGIVLLPLRAVAGTITVLFAYDAAVGPTATAPVETGPSLRPENGGVPEYVYDEAHDRYDDGETPTVLLGARAAHGYDRALALLDRREVGDGVIYAAADAPTAAESFANQLPGQLVGELEAAANAGATVVRAGGPAFDAVINQGTAKSVVTESGELLIAPHSVGGVEISHAVPSGGRPVLAAREAEIAGAGGKYVKMNISNWSGHFMPSEASLSVARAAFGAVGVTF